DRRRGRRRRPHPRDDPPIHLTNDQERKMTERPREDFFTVMHKALRRELFALTTLAGSIDWNDTDDTTDLRARWDELQHLLEFHAAHEDEHYFPLLRDVAPEALATVEREHKEHDQALAALTESIGAATAANGLQVYRELSA